jgi:hypothetical protein
MFLQSRILEGPLIQWFNMVQQFFISLFAGQVLDLCRTSARFDLCLQLKLDDVLLFLELNAAWISHQFDHTDLASRWPTS